MRLDWKRTTLGNLQAEGLAELQTGPFGTVLKASEYSEKGVPVISVGEIREGYIQIHDRTPFVSSDVTTKLSKYVLKEGDIVFGRKGSIERNAIINKDQDGWFLGSDGIRLRLNKAINSVFLSYQLRQKSNQKWLMSNGVGSTMPSLNQKILDRLPIWLPAKNEQDIIAKLLSDLDAKIEFNNKINSELEGMAKLMYDYWFVQFDFPFDFRQGKPADETSNPKDVRPYKSSGGKMVWNKELKREVPEGWGVLNLFDCSKVQYGFPFSTEHFNESQGVPVIRIRDIVENKISNYSTENSVDQKYKIEVGDLLIGMDGNFHLNYWSIPDCYLNQRVVKISKSILPLIYLKHQIQPFIKLREKSVSRTTVGHLSDKDLKSIHVLVPSKVILVKISELFDQYLNKLLQNRTQNQQLSELRDWLLPMLMNGQVIVD